MIKSKTTFKGPKDKKGSYEYEIYREDFGQIPNQSIYDIFKDECNFTNILQPGSYKHKTLEEIDFINIFQSNPITSHLKTKIYRNNHKRFLFLELYINDCLILEKKYPYEILMDLYWEDLLHRLRDQMIYDEEGEEEKEPINPKCFN